MNGHRITGAWFDEAHGFTLEQLGTWHHIAQGRIAERRADLVRHLHYRYGVTAHPHPRRPAAVVVSASDHALLEHLVMTDPTLTAVGRGYYLWLGGELDVIVAPDWACSPTRVALARLYVVAVARPLTPIIRALTRRLLPYGGNTA